MLYIAMLLSVSQYCVLVVNAVTDTDCHIRPRKNFFCNSFCNWHSEPDIWILSLPITSAFKEITKLQFGNRPHIFIPGLTACIMPIFLSYCQRGLLFLRFDHDGGCRIFILKNCYNFYSWKWCYTHNTTR